MNIKALCALSFMMIAGMGVSLSAAQERSPLASGIFDQKRVNKLIARYWPKGSSFEAGKKNIVDAIVEINELLTEQERDLAIHSNEKVAHQTQEEITAFHDMLDYLELALEEMTKRHKSLQSGAHEHASF